MVAMMAAQAYDLYRALEKAPRIPVGFMEWTRRRQILWLCDYLDWFRDVRETALLEAKGR
jgi:hypothetical protein